MRSVLKLFVVVCVVNIHVICSKNISSSHGVVVASYCETEVFNASCPLGSAILMTHAHYGRMQLGRCVKYDYGHVGCYADVIELADERCSGRPSCDIAIPDSSFSQTLPCPQDLKPYLEAGYNCIPVQMPVGPCPANRPLPVTSFPVSYMASYVTELTGCGGAASPWLITAVDGQTIDVTLYDFASSRHRALSSADKPLPRSDMTPSSPPAACPVYAVITEQDGERHRNVSVCGGGLTRERHVYSSLTNQIAVSVTIDELGDDVTDNLPYYLLKYEVIGCPSAIDVDATVNALVSRDGGHLAVNCNWTLREFYMKCVGSRWVDDLNDCNQAPYLVLQSESAINFDEDSDLFAHDIGQFCLVVITTATLIGLFVLITGLFIIQRRRVKRRERMTTDSPTLTSPTWTAKTRPVATSVVNNCQHHQPVYRDKSPPEVRILHADDRQPLGALLVKAGSRSAVARGHSLSSLDWLIRRLSSSSGPIGSSPGCDDVVVFHDTGSSQAPSSPCLRLMLVDEQQNDVRTK